VAQRFLTPIDLSQNELRQALAHLLGADPAAPLQGQFWFHTTSGTWRFSTGTTTVILGRLDQISAPEGDVSLAGQRITNLASPVNAGDAATRGYVDGVVTAISWKDSVRVATTAAGALTTDFADASVVDGVTLAAGDRILIKDQATASENGIYIVQATGTPLRAEDANSADEIRGAAMLVEEGTTNANSLWLLSTDAPITLGTTGLTFVQLGSSTAPEGPQKFAADVGDGVATQFAITHNLGTRDVTVLVRQNAAPYAQVYTDVEATDINTVTIRFATAPATAAYRVICIG
jgi:phage-related tail fiber protein